ncbi:hypothetical protein DERF_008809 [Dermatophagoides farinae]|uniref:Uncharacterized protein n=1 Tax=Dermatophagoides farinae TaxID=6954 RepID=A0A922L4Q3_DERFA|nr:hypothetical protein DERF_008809 [Dermatophagoides farinae]
MKRKVQLTFIRTDRLTDRPTDTYREYQYFGYLAMKKNEDKKKKKKLNDEDEDEDKSNWAFNNPHMAMFWFIRSILIKLKISTKS